MKIKTNELTGTALDWAVAKCEGITVLPKMRGGCYVTLNRGETVLLCYSTDWALAGLIIEQECIAISCIGVTGYTPDTWNAQHPQRAYARGKTPLIAAMRCYVASKLGDEVEIPEELQTITPKP